jgi:hypothetical protein
MKEDSTMMSNNWCVMNNWCVGVGLVSSCVWGNSNGSDDWLWGSINDGLSDLCDQDLGGWSPVRVAGGISSWDNGLDNWVCNSNRPDDWLMGYNSSDHWGVDNSGCVVDLSVMDCDGGSMVNCWSVVDNWLMINCWSDGMCHDSMRVDHALSLIRSGKTSGRGCGNDGQKSENNLYRRNQLFVKIFCLNFPNMFF